MTNDLPKLPPPYYFHWVDRSDAECMYILREDIPNESNVDVWPHTVVSYWDRYQLHYGRTRMFAAYGCSIACESREEALRLIELLANLGEL